MHTLPTLPYNYDALEPHIDARTMEIHYTKHHQGYLDKLNTTLEGHDDLQKKSIKELLSDLNSIPEDIRVIVRNNGGGHYNHSLFWESMKSNGGGEPSGDFAESIKNTFSSFEKFQEEFNDKAGKHFGSGWCWLVTGDKSELQVITTPNQDNPVTIGLTPLLGLDIWEHAYYLNYQNRRLDYINAWWNVVNWEEVARRYNA